MEHVVTDSGARQYSDTVIAAASLGFVWLGDSLIYVVLPLYPAAFGIETASVAILLSVNRVIRIIGYGWVSPLSRRFGANTLTAVACAAAALSTLAYGLVTGFALLFLARLVWGAAFGVINLTNTAYAYGDGRRAGMRIGLNRAVSSLGPVLALGLGGWLVTLVGPQSVFVIYGVAGFIAVPLALRLPQLRQTVGDAAPVSHRRWVPSPLNMVFFVVALGADGVFTATLSTLLADIIPVTSALIGAGLLLAGQRLISVVLAFASGPIVDRFEAQRMLAPCSFVIAAGMIAIATGHVYSGAVILMVARAMFAIIGPIIAAQQSADRIGAIAAYSTWSDCGLAAGAFLGIVGMQWAGFPLTYVTLAATTLATLGWFMLRAPSAPPPGPA
jgi:MFS transporter, DHA1 family, inner membrane transport protein